MNTKQLEFKLESAKISYAFWHEKEIQARKQMGNKHSWNRLLKLKEKREAANMEIQGYVDLLELLKGVDDE